MASDASQAEKAPDLILTTINDEIEAELVERIIEHPRNPTRNPNSRNGIKTALCTRKHGDFRLLLMKFWLKVSSLASGCQG